ncbi:amino acid synthesis family protein [Pelosinus propionicus]|uniref:Amino acid synthesis n=1 Tax=Pelosinus propionicus DSM 13327 TaxID=1123291 RepID=A0A1I4I3D9_9FIRM|nr:amino acid synthesis family protein [Pelosinus propionicus]SFL48627.1 Amino acid synthesis [Pelosinus propionicus DSM 13327]
MKEPIIRKIVTNVEEICFEGFKKLERPLHKCIVAAVIKNPYAGAYGEDLSQLIEIGEYLGEYLTKIAVKNLGTAVIESYGKGAIIGANGELEHGAAILHPKLGKPMRDVIGGGKAIIPSAKKCGGPGTSLDVPLHYKDAAFVRTHYDAMEIRIADAPKSDEIVVAVAFTDGGRPHARIGGLQISEVKGEDGLR